MPLSSLDGEALGMIVDGLSLVAFEGVKLGALEGSSEGFKEGE